MQLTTINKIISYLLFGSLAAALIALHFKEAFPNKLPDGTGLVMPLIFLSVAVCLGCVIEGIRSVLAHHIIQAILNPINADEDNIHWTTTSLGLSQSFKNYQLCHKQFETAFLQSESQSYPEVFADLEVSLRSFATGLFFSKSNSDAINQVNSHYATYILASGFLILVITAPFWYFLLPFKISYGYLLLIVPFWFVALYSLTGLSLNMYLYSYEVVFRQAYITLKDSAQKRIVSTCEGENTQA